MVKLVTAPQRLEHEDEGRVLVGSTASSGSITNANLLSHRSNSSFDSIQRTNCEASAASAAVSLRSRLGPRPTRRNRSFHRGGFGGAKSPSGPHAISIARGRARHHRGQRPKRPRRRPSRAFFWHFADGVGNRNRRRICIWRGDKLCLAAASASRAIARSRSVAGLRTTACAHSSGHSADAPVRPLLDRKSIRGPLMIAVLG